MKEVAAILREQSLPLQHEAAAPEPPVRSGPVLVTSFDHKRVNTTGIVVTLLLHVLVVLLAWFQPEEKPQKPPPPSVSDLTYVLPVKTDKPAVVPEKKPAPKPDTKPREKPRPEPRREVAKVERLPDTITLPEERKVEPEPVETPKPPEIAKVDPSMDMSEMIAQRRRARERANGEQPQETEAERGDRIARANIATANRKSSSGDDANGTGGLFTVDVHSPMTATLRFNGWNPNFNRRWLQQLEVELGNEPDIQSALVKKMIVLIRKEKKGDFTFRSERQQRDVTLSARVEDNDQLEDFLFKEVFPNHKRRK